MAEMKAEVLPSQGQEAQEAPVKSEEEKPEGGPSSEPAALSHPAGTDQQEGPSSQASASNATPAAAKVETGQEPHTAAPTGEGQPPEDRAWENRQREVPPPSRQPGVKGSSCWSAEPRRSGMSTTIPCRGNDKGRARKPGRNGSRLFLRQPNGSHPRHRQPTVMPTLVGGTKNGKDGSNGGMNIGPEGGPPVGRRK